MPSARSPESRFVLHKGSPRPAVDPILPADDGLAVCGRGAFETLAAYRGRPFLPLEHFARLRRAAEVLGLECPGDGELLEGMTRLLEANGLADAEKARVRLTLSSPADGSASWWIEATPPPPHALIAKVVTGPFFRNERSPLAGLKTVNYGENVVAQRHAREAGADEALFANTRGELCEGTWSNVFVRSGGRWLTPPLDSGCLPGVTRALVIELFREIGEPVEESTLPMSGIGRVESAFLTSSLREIQPVGSIDGRSLDLPPLLQRLYAAYGRRREEQ